MIFTSHPARRARLIAGIALVAVIGLSLPAAAAQLVKVRAGAHANFTRVVFELDGASGYRVEKVGTDAAPMLRITLDAGSRFHRLNAHGDVRGVKVTAGTRAVATIALGRSDLRVQEMLLSNPHRIVLDLYRPESALAVTPAPKKRSTPPEPKPVAKTTPAPKAEPAPKPVAKTTPAPKAEPTPEPVAKTTPAPKAEPTPKPVAKTQPAPKPEPAVTPVPKPLAEAKPAPKPIAEATPAPIARPEPAPKASEPEVPPAVKIADAPKPAIVPPPPTEVAPLRRVPPSPKRAPAETAKSAPVAPATPESAPASPSFMDRLTGDRIWQGGIAAAVIGLIAIVFVVRRRYRALPNDLDVTAIAEEVEEAGRHPEGGFAMEAPMGAEASLPVSKAAEAPLPASKAAEAETSFAGLFDEADEASEPAAQFADAPVARVPDPVARVTETPVASDTDSPFDSTGGLVGAEAEASEGDAPMMNQDMDLPVDPNMSSPPPVMGGAAAPSADVAQMLQDFERRMQTLEAKLGEAEEAREKLERQVAAQSEELRVQRAAIARTQRALRTMSRADEDKATEPAIREGDTQAKTRVNV
jgi:hypothetical protein